LESTPRSKRSLTVSVSVPIPTFWSRLRSKR
jgi:hypothetical protein